MANYIKAYSTNKDAEQLIRDDLINDVTTWSSRKINQKIGSGGGGSISTEITSAGYEALSDEDKNNGTAYFVKDADTPQGKTIDDNVTTDNTTWSSEKIKEEITGELYYENYRIDNPVWTQQGNIFYASSVITFTDEIRFKIISAQVFYWSGFYPWAICDHGNEGSDKLTVGLFSATNAEGWCIIRVWFKK